MERERHAWTTWQWNTLYLVVVVLLFLSALGWWNGVVGTFQRILFITTAIFVLAAVYGMFDHLLRPRSIPLIAVFSILSLGAATYFTVNAGSADPERIRSRFLTDARGYMGTRFVWGGETGGGIDCSGLARAAFVRSCLRESLRAGDGALLLRTVRFWWFDIGAVDLGHERDDMTVRIGEVPNLRDFDGSGVRPGDMAVSIEHRHILIYSGGGQWIEADPGRGEVIELSPEDDPEHLYFTVPVVFVRWTALD